MGFMRQCSLKSTPQITTSPNVPLLHGQVFAWQNPSTTEARGGSFAMEPPLIFGMKTGRVANLYVTTFKVHSTHARVPSQLVRSGTMTKNGLSTSSFVFPRSISDTIHITPKPFQSDLADLPTWNLSPNGQFNSNTAYTLSKNSPTASLT